MEMLVDTGSSVRLQGSHINIALVVDLGRPYRLLAQDKTDLRLRDRVLQIQRLCRIQANDGIQKNQGT